MMKRSQLFLGLLAILFPSCGSPIGSGVSYDLKGGDSFPAQLVRGVTFIQLDPAKPISTVSKVEYVEGKYYILTTEGLYRYSNEGLYEGQISRMGRSEQEWLHLDTFYYSERSHDLCLVDCASSKILHYSLAGTFLSSTRVKSLNKYHVSQAEETAAGVLLACSIYNDSGIIYALLDEDDRAVRDLKYVPFKTDNVIQRIGIHPISCTLSGVKCIVPVSNTLLVLNRGNLVSGPTVPVLNPLPKKRFLEAHTESYSPYVLAAECLKNDLFCGYDGVFETDDYLLLSSFNQYYTFIDKHSRQGWVLNRIDLVGKTGTVWDNIVASSGNMLISTMNGIQVKRYLSDTELLDSLSAENRDYLSAHGDDFGAVYLIVTTIQ